LKHSRETLASLSGRASFRTLPKVGDKFRGRRMHRYFARQRGARAFFYMFRNGFFRVPSIKFATPSKRCVGGDLPEAPRTCKTGRSRKNSAVFRPKNRGGAPAQLSRNFFARFVFFFFFLSSRDLSKKPSVVKPPTTATRLQEQNGPTNAPHALRRGRSRPPPEGKQQRRELFSHALSAPSQSPCSGRASFE